MTQQSKKPGQQSQAKTASGAAGKPTESVVETTRGAAENVLKIGSSAVKDMLANGASEAQKVQERAFEFGRESADKLAKSADAACQALYEMAGMSRSSAEAAVECSNLTSSFIKDLSAEIFEYTNKSFSDQIEISKEFFGCRTLNDMVELQQKLIKNSLDSWFSETGKISGMILEYSSEAAQPLNEKIAEAGDQFVKTFSQRA